jgi:hypothetical protein
VFHAFNTSTWEIEAARSQFEPNLKYKTRTCLKNKICSMLIAVNQRENRQKGKLKVNNDNFFEECL